MAKDKVKDKDFANMEKVQSNYRKYVTKDFHFYLSYGARVALIFVAVFLLGVLSYYCFKQSFSKESKESLNYQIDKDVKYNVVLFDNPLGIKNDENTNSNLSELVNDISNDFHYEYTTEKPVDVNYSYDFEVKMVLEDKNTKEVFYTNTYPLNEKKITNSIKNTTVTKIDQNIQLDYDFYNEKAKEMEQLASGPVEGKLILTMHIELETKYDKFAKKVTKDDVIEAYVPLLSNQVSTKMVSEPNSTDKYEENAKPQLVNESMLYSGVAIIILDTMFLLSGISFMFKSTPKKSKYCKLRDGLLSEYDSVIVKARKMPDIKGKNLVDCYSFGELMDAQKIVEKPIIYYEIVKDQKCVFFIIGDDDIYEYTLKECDIEF